MFSEEFFPTPKSVIKKMIKPYLGTRAGKYGSDWIGKDVTILEPSAGKGDILDYLKELGAENLYCIEQNIDLQSILKEKGYRLINSDFLKYNGDYVFDLIVMNPPFSNGAEHLLKAWDIMNGGDIICLLNSETINNPFSKSRKLLCEIIKQHGSVEHIGAAFSDSERVTNVEVCIVRLKKPLQKSKFDFDFNQESNESKIELDENTFKDAVMTNDVIGNMITQSENLKQAYINYRKAKAELEFYSQGLLDGRSISNIVEESEKSHNKNHINVFNDELKHAMWSNIMSKTNVQKYMTSSVRENFQKYLKEQGCMDFTKENIFEMINLIFNNRDTILNEAVIDVFDLFTKFHAENRIHVEGWKTNDKFKVNKKIILPHTVGLGYNGKYEPSTWQSSYRKFEDIDKVMCYLTGESYESMDKKYIEGQYVDGKFTRGYWEYGDSISGTIYKVPIGSTEKYESRFFYIRCYKKGTIHLFFKDERLWQEFNLRACAGKNWLPESEMNDYYNRQKQKQNSNQLMLA